MATLTHLGLSGCLAASAAVGAANVPPRPPPGEGAFAFRATGVQIYQCAPNGAGVAWRLQAPEAELRDSSGAVVGRHFAGPSWQARDSSTVVGEPLASSPAPQPGAINWVVLRATTHSGTGLFARFAYVTRTNTSGGVAPTAGCDPATAGRTVRVPYAATYTFFPTEDRRP